MFFWNIFTCLFILRDIVVSLFCWEVGIFHSHPYLFDSWQSLICCSDKFRRRWHTVTASSSESPRVSLQSSEHWLLTKLWITLRFVPEYSPPCVSFLFLFQVISFVYSVVLALYKHGRGNNSSVLVSLAPSMCVFLYHGHFFFFFVFWEDYLFTFSYIFIYPLISFHRTYSL